MSKSRILFALLAWLYVSGLLVAKSPQFVPADESPVHVGHGSGPVLLRDLNQDGHLDLVTKHLFGQIVSVLPGDGHGHFLQEERQAVRLTYQPGNIELGDVNNDGILDLAIAKKDNESESVEIYVGSEEGFQFGSTLEIRASMKTYKPSLLFVDLNEDRNLDIVASNGRRNIIDILLGNGEGRFSPHGVVELDGGKNYYSFEVGDWNSDKHIDLVVALSGANADEGPGQIVTFFGDGKGALVKHSGKSTSVLSEPRVASVADMDRDGDLDLVLLHSTLRALTALTNDGHGSFAAGTTIGVDQLPFSVVAADINNDGITDLVVATVQNEAAPFASQVVVLMGDGRNFTPAAGSPFAAGPGAYTVTVGDVDEDGNPDIAASSFEGDAVTVLLGQ